MADACEAARANEGFVVGVFVDIAAMWLKAFLSPGFFWLHIPGGGLFAAIFAFVFVRAMKEMWRKG